MAFQQFHFRPNPNLVNNSFGGGLANARSLVDLINQRKDRSRLQELADLARGGLGNQDVANQIGAELIGLGQIAGGINAQNVPYNREQQRLQREFQNRQLEAVQGQRNFQNDIALQRLGLDRARLDVAQNAPANFTSPVQAIDAQGNPVFIQTDNRGNVQPVTGFTPNNPIKTIDTGTEQVIVDSRTGNVLSRTPVDNRQESFDKALGSEQGKLSAEFPAMKRKAAGALRSMVRKQDTVQTAIADAKKIVKEEGGTTGLIGSVVGNVPGTDAYTLRQKLMTIKSNIGFDTLQTMRDNSPTGGALGQVSNLELELLQAVEGALNQGLDDKVLLATLDRIDNLYSDLLDERQAAFAQTFGTVYDDGSGQITPGSGNVSGNPDRLRTIQGTATPDEPPIDVPTAEQLQSGERTTATGIRYRIR